jgi:WD40 repeat protein
MGRRIIGKLALLFALQLGLIPSSAIAEKTLSPILKLDTGGHQGSIIGTKYSSDGNELVTAGEFDQTIKVWDWERGKLLRTIRGYDIPQSIEEGHYEKSRTKLVDFDIDPKGRFIVCGTNVTGDQLRIIDYSTGRIVGTTDVMGLSCLSFSRDGERLAVGSDFGMLCIYDRQCLWSDRHPDEADHDSRYVMTDKLNLIHVSFSPASDMVATAYGDGTLEIYRVDDLKLLCRNAGASESKIIHLEWSLDGQGLLTSDENGIIQEWRAEDLSKVGIVYRAPREAPLTFSFAGPRTLLIGGELHDTYGGISKFPLIAYDLDTGEERLLMEHNNTISGIAVSPDMKTVSSTGGNDGEILVWDLATKRLYCRLAGEGRTIFGLAWMREGPELAFGRIGHKAPTDSQFPLEKVFSLVDRRVSAVSGETVLSIAGGDGHEWITVASPERNELKIGDSIVSFSHKNDYAYCYSYSPDFSSIFVGCASGLYRIDPITKTIDCRYNFNDAVFSMSVSEDSRIIATLGWDQTIYLWDTNSIGEKPLTQEEVLEVAPYIEKLRALEEVRKPGIARDLNLDDHNDLLTYYKRLSAVGEGDAEFLINKASVLPLLSLFIGTDDEWIAWTPEGYYDCSLDGAKYAGWHFNMGEDKNAEFYSLEQYASVFYRPDVIEKALNRVHMDLPTVSFENRPPRITSFKINGQANYDEGEITITTDKSDFSIELASTGTTSLRQPELFYNGRVISQGKFKGPPAVKLAADKMSLTASYSFSVSGKDNRYKIYTVDDRGFKSAAKTVRVIYTGKDASPAFYKLGEKVAKPAVAGTLYVLAVGIDEYTNPEMAKEGMGNLSYAEKDATDMAALMASQEGKLFDKVEATVLTKDRLGRDVTQSDILDAITAIGKKMPGERDSILVFLSGHGLRKDDGFFFLSSEADPMSKATLEKTSPSWVAIGEKLKSFTRAKEIVVLVDACHSGAINPTELGFTWKDKGIVLMTSSRAGQKSYEGGSYIGPDKKTSVFENGYFTKAIVEGFTRAAGKATGVDRAPADSSQDDVLIIGEVLNYATQKVGEWSGGAQTPWVPAYDPAIEGKVLGVVR